jgi:hypothetical protein
MDISTLDIVIKSCLGVLIGLLAYLARGFEKRLGTIETTFQAHVVEDKGQFATLTSKSEEVMRLLSDIKHSLELLNAKMDGKK